MTFEGKEEVDTVARQDQRSKYETPQAHEPWMNRCVLDGWIVEPRGRKGQVDANLFRIKVASGRRTCLARDVYREV